LHTVGEILRIAIDNGSHSVVQNWCSFAAEFRSSVE
jgi:hypothetical protein